MPDLSLERPLTMATVSVAVAYLFVLGPIVDCLSGPKGGNAWPIVIPGPIAAILGVVFAIVPRSFGALSRRRRRLRIFVLCIAIVGLPASYIASNFFIGFRWDLRN